GLPINFHPSSTVVISPGCHKIDNFKGESNRMIPQSAHRKGQSQRTRTARELQIDGYGILKSRQDSLGGIKLRLKTKFVIAPPAAFLVESIALNIPLEAQGAHFHNAPASSAQEKNP